MIGQYHLKRALLALAVLASGLVVLLFARLFSIPTHPGFEASLLEQRAAVVSVLAVGVALVIATAAGSLIAGRVRYEAGFFAAAAGLAVLSFRGGTMRYVLFEAGSNTIFLLLAIETVLLFMLLAVSWRVLSAVVPARLIPPPAGEEDDSLNQRLLALAATTAFMLLIQTMLLQTDEKMQAIASTFIAAILAAMGAHALFPTRSAAWYWPAPGIVGVIGYLWAWSNPGKFWSSGWVDHPLARALPLDYASAGAAGAVLGFWLSRRNKEKPVANSVPGQPAPVSA